VELLLIVCTVAALVAIECYARAVRAHNRRMEAQLKRLEERLR
jgi:hypothetical protein